MMRNSLENVFFRKPLFRSNNTVTFRIFDLLEKLFAPSVKDNYFHLKTICFILFKLEKQILEDIQT